MEAVEAYEDLDYQLGLAEKHIKELAKIGQKKATARKDYRVALATAELYERTENNTPVSIVGDICRGRENVAELKCKLEIAESLYDACRENIFLAKKRADVLREQISREYTQAGWRN